MKLSDKFSDLREEFQNLGRENDATEIYQERVNRLIWKRTNLEKQLVFWRAYLTAAKRVYRHTVLCMQDGTSYDWVPADWEPLQKRMEKYASPVKHIRQAQTADKLLAMTA